jgi:hypothetical protein
MINLQYGYLNDNGEYIGNYEGCRVRCKDCKHSCHEIGLSESKRKCSKINLIINENNNVCNQFSPSIINPSHTHEFNFDEYFEWLMNDFYRPYKATDEIVYYIDRPAWYQYDERLKIPVYKTVDCLRCTIHTPDCHVHVGKHHFQIDYRNFRNLSFLNGDEINYKIHYFKEKETSRKYTTDYNGSLKVNKLI